MAEHRLSQLLSVSVGKLGGRGVGWDGVGEKLGKGP